MQIQTMKTIDRYLGQALCGALRGLDLITSPSPKLSDLPARDQLRNILLIKFWGMGSLLLAAPVFRTLRRSHPDSKIHLATLAQNATVVRVLGIADQVHPLVLGQSPLSTALSILRYFDEIRSIRADAVIDMEYLTRFSAAVAYISGAPVRVGFHSWDVWRGDLHNYPVAFSPYWHVVDNFMNLHRALAGDCEPDLDVNLMLNEDDQAGADDAIEKIRSRIPRSGRLIVVNPNASTMALQRRWPEEYFIELIDRMTEQDLGCIALIGAPEEAPFVGSVMQRLKRPDAAINLAGQLTIIGLIGVLRGAALLVTNDSGPLHIADILGTPTVSFFGPETPLLYGPRGKRHTILYKGIDCSPCISIYNAKTVRCLRQRPECLYRITVDEALEAVKARLRESGH